MKKRINACVVIFSLILAVSIGLFYSHSLYAEGEESVSNQNTIYDGISIGVVPVGGMTKDQAKLALTEYVGRLSAATIKFKSGDTEYTIPLVDMEYSADVDQAVSLAYSYARTGNLLKRYKAASDIQRENVVIDLTQSINQELLLSQVKAGMSACIVNPTEPEMSMSGGKPVVTEGVSGQTIDDETTINNFYEALKAYGEGDVIEVSVAIKEVEPTHKAEELYAVSDVLASFDTKYSSGDASRNNNIANAAEKISGKVLYPGEEFDTMSYLVPFTEENGWSYAGAYNNGEVVSDIGGGICQVSSTLYNAVLRAELQITERYPHSMAVGYVPISADAALNEGTKNFKFVNNLENPVFVYAYASGGTMHVTIYGKEYRESGRKIEFENEIIETYEPGEPVETVDEEKPSDYRAVTQSAHTGYSAKFWKKVYVNGELVDTIQVNSSYYAASPERVTIGKPEEANPEENPAENPQNPAENPENPSPETSPAENAPQ